MRCVILVGVVLARRLKSLVHTLSSSSLMPMRVLVSLVSSSSSTLSWLGGW